MTWRDEYQIGSFRGASFKTTSHEASGGRRNVIHELPGRDEPIVEDLGGAAATFSIEVFVAGAEYFSDREQLRAALDAPGPGTLVHPWLGQMQVSVLDWTLSESTEEGGIGRFSITFSEAGTPVAASQSADGQVLSIDAADFAIAAAPERFAASFDLDGWPSFVEEAAGSLVSGLAVLTQIRAGIGGGTGPALRAFETGLAALGLGGLLRSPLALGHALVGLVQAVSLLGGPPRRRIAAFSSMIAYDPAGDPTLIAGSGSAAISMVSVANAPTPARRREASNRDALVHLYRVAAAAELVRAVAGTSFISLDEAQAIRAATNQLLDDVMIVAADAGQDDRVADLDALRRAVVRDIGLRAPQLPALRDLPTRAAEPALVIANRLYGHGSADTRAQDIVARNKVAHPAFVPAGTTLKVIVNG